MIKRWHGAVASHHYETLFKGLGDKEKQLISESSELENEYKSEVSSINTKKKLGNDIFIYEVFYK